MTVYDNYCYAYEFVYVLTYAFMKKFLTIHAFVEAFID